MGDVCGSGAHIYLYSLARCVNNIWISIKLVVIIKCAYVLDANFIDHLLGVRY